MKLKYPIDVAVPFGGRAFMDRYGRTWPYAREELCGTCGQPDNCGDCSHKKLSNEDVLRILLDEEGCKAIGVKP